MAKNGFRLIDAEMHVMEPTDLWLRYIAPEFRERAPRRLDERRWDIRTMVEGEVMTAMPGGDWPAVSDAEEKALGDRYADEIARDFDPASQVKAMDKEGLDLAILFPTSAMYVTAFSTMDARFAAAACRAYNDWLYDYIEAADPTRMFGAAAVSPHDAETAAVEARRAVIELGMKAIFIRPNIHNERPWHDRYYDPLWSACQELNVPVGFHETTGSRMKACGTDRFNTMGIAHIATHSMEQMLACFDLIMGGTFERFPRLRSGGMEGAQTRDLLAIAGGSTEDFARAKPLLDAIAKRVMYTGGIGTGSIAKIMHNSATFTLDLVMAECWTTGVKAGIDPVTIVKVFTEAALGNQTNLKVRLPATYLKGNFDARFSLALAHKDLGLALDLARETATPMRLSALAKAEMDEAMERGWADRDASIFLTLQEERAAVEVRVDE